MRNKRLTSPLPVEMGAVMEKAKVVEEVKVMAEMDEPEVILQAEAADAASASGIHGVAPAHFTAGSARRFQERPKSPRWNFSHHFCPAPPLRKVKTDLKSARRDAFSGVSGDAR